MTTIQNFHNQNINSLKFPNQNVYSTIQNFLNQNVYSKKMPQTTCLLCKTVTCLLGLLVDQSSVARLDLYGEHLGGRNPAGLVPGSNSSDTPDEVLFSVPCIAWTPRSIYIYTYTALSNLGIPNTLDMALTGKTLDAKKAKKVGLVDAVVDPLGKFKLYLPARRYFKVDKKSLILVMKNPINYRLLLQIMN